MIAHPHLVRGFIFKNPIKAIPCLLMMHDWTCAAGEGIKPTQKQLDDGIDGFYDYATMYCKRCHCIYKPRSR